MKIEHIAFNVADPDTLREWLVENLGMRVLRKLDNEFHTCFLSDSAGTTALELYNNPSAPIPDYASMNPLVLHIAFCVDDVTAVRQRLLDAGAAPEGDVVSTPDGDELAMVREPGGIALQLMKRAKPMVP